MTPEERVVNKIKQVLQEENCVLVIRDNIEVREFGTGLTTEVKVVYACDTTRDGVLLHSE